MLLDFACGCHPGPRRTYMHREPACAMAAEGNVTNGPGGINDLNGVLSVQ
jgi:hypothetical protein